MDTNGKLVYEKPKLIKHAQLREVTLASNGGGRGGKGGENEGDNGNNGNNGNNNGNGNGNGNK